MLKFSSPDFAFEESVFIEGRPIYAKLRENATSAVLTCYTVTLFLWYIFDGVLFQLSLGLCALLLLPLILALGRRVQFVRETAPFLVLLLSYEALQGVAGSIAITPVIHATANTGRVTYGLLEAVQSTFLSPDLTDIMTIFYGLHFPLVIGSAFLLWRSNRILYKGYVYSLVACSYISLVFFIFVPSAPPWYNGVVSNLLTSTSSQVGPSSLIGEVARFGSMIESDKLAAFPSLHAAYVMLFGYFTIKLKRAYGLVSIPITAGVLFSTIYLGQHYIVDLAAGIAIAVSCALSISKLVRDQGQASETCPSELSQAA